MRCIAVISTTNPGIDTVIVWDDSGRLVAFAYEHGQVKMTRPLTAATLEEGITELQAAFQINAGQVARITDWTNFAAPPAQTGPMAGRWDLAR